MEVNKIFLIAVAALVLYWVSPQKQRSGILLLAGFVLYASIHIRFALLLFVSCSVDYALSIAIQKTEDRKRRRLLFILGVFFNIGVWFFFKYFVDFLYTLFPNAYWLLYFAVPLGLSFYTFHKLSYLVDVYKKKIAPPQFSDYLLYVTYFPKLISGPIERTGVFLSKLDVVKEIRDVDFRGSFYLVVWGLFKKFVVSGSLVVIIDDMIVLREPTFTQVLFLAYLIPLNIFADFSGYTDIVRGISKLFCIELSRNFDFPLFTKNPLDYFKKWHITLMMWMRDYIYMPLFGYLSSKTIIFRIKNPRWRFGLAAFIALFITFVVYSFWHGGGGYILLGSFFFIAICCFTICEYLCRGLFLKRGKFIAPTIDTVRMAVNFNVLAVASLFYVLQTHKTLPFITAAFQHFNFGGPPKELTAQIFFLLMFFFVYELIQYLHKDEQFVCKKGVVSQIFFYLTLFFLFINVEAVQNTGFIYFQF